VRKTAFILFAFLSTSFSLFAQDFSADLIPANLTKNANLVVRTKDQSFEIQDSGRGYYKLHYAYTILNPAGDKYSNLVVQYDKFVNIESVSGTLYDAHGKKIKSMKKSDMEDLSASDGFSLMNDDRYKVQNFNWKIYPYTIEYEITEQWNGLLFFPSWAPIQNEKISLEKSTLTVKCPFNYQIRYKLLNKVLEPTIQDIENKKIYRWSLENFQAIEDEPFSPYLSNVLPEVLLAPSSFKMQNYTGRMTDWKSFGSFYFTLNQGRDKLPENIRAKVHQLTDGISSQKEKIKILYEYMQKNTRYVSVQLGIGGWQTFDANYVATKGYGDCKALSNYMMSLLKEAGIPSNVVVIRAEEMAEKIQSDFTSNQFNHVILCVPQKKDTIWLECTSQTQPFGYLGSFTDNRFGLLVDSINSKLVHTPIYKKMENAQVRKIEAKIDSDGHLDAQIITRYRALQQDRLSSMINSLSKEKVEEELKESLNLPSYDLNAFNYEEIKTTLPEIREKLTISANNFATVTGKRIFINPNILNKSNTKIPNPETRKLGFLFNYAWIDIDTVEMVIPKGYIPESIPADVNEVTPFGTYQTRLEVKPGKILYIRNTTRNGGEYPVKDAQALADYYDKIYRSDRKKLVLVKI